MSLIRGRDTAAILLLSTLLCLVSLCGCGQKIEGPSETPGGLAPPPNTYILTYEWNNFPGTTDIIVTTGGFVYVAQESTQVAAYTTFSPKRHPLIADLVGLARPVLVAEGADEQIYVADAGDTTVKKFSRSGGSPIQVFRDTAWVAIGGIAADEAGFLYVADRQKEMIWKYISSGIRDSSFGTNGVLSEGGEGVGYVRQPGGMCFDGVYLQVTDTGKNRVQKLVPDEFAFGVLSVTGPSLEDPFESPLDSAADSEGNIYVADTGKRRVLKYDSSGFLLATVNWDSTVVVGEIPAVAAKDKWVYVADPEHNRILIYELR
ncbi:MAG: NHL repeat-containing protein [Candidatus Eiseniibacteriota bacterium]|nr:MAG: NHL repeat-containing protein [Candidatus Eisenbacteria bacterium]